MTTASRFLLPLRRHIQAGPWSVLPSPNRGKHNDREEKEYPSTLAEDRFGCTIPV